MAIRFYESIRRVVSDYTLVASDEYIGVGQREVGVTLTLPAIGDIGQMVGFVIKDESGQANALNITLQASGVEEIQGNSTYTVNVNYGSVEVFHNGTMWIVRASNDPQILPVNAGGTGANTAQGAVDNLGLDIKDPVTVSAKTNIDLSAIPDEVNGVTLDVGDSVNLWLQTDATENGVYTVVDPGTGTDGVWERRSDFNTSSEIRAGVRFLSLQGNSFSNVYFVVLTNEPEIGVDNIEIAPQNNADPVIDAYGNTVFGYSYQESATNYVRAENTVAESAAVLRGYSDTEDHVSLSLEGKGFGRTWTGTPLIENLDATTITTAGDVTYTPVQVLGGLMSRDPNGADRTDTLPSAADIIAYIPQSFQDLAWTLRVHNTADAAETITLTAGAGIVWHGALTIEQGEVAEFYFVITNDTPSSEEVTMYRMNVSSVNIELGDGLTEVDGAITADISSEFQFLGNQIYAKAIGASRLQEYVTNQTGGNLTSGTAVALRPNSDGTLGVVKADSSTNVEATHVVGSLDINDTASGFVTKAITFGSLDTSGASANGAPIYLDMAGSWSYTSPTGSNSLVQVVGYVGVKDAVNGTILYMPQPPTRFGTAFLQDDAVSAAKIGASFSLAYRTETASSPFKRLYAGSITGDTPVVGATLLQAVTGATAEISFLNDNSSIDVISVTGTFDATNVVTGTNPDTSTFTFTPTMTLIDCWPIDYAAAGFTSATSNDGTVLPFSSSTQLLTTNKIRFQPTISITQGQLETLTSDGWTDIDVEYTRSEVVVA